MIYDGCNEYGTVHLRQHLVNDNDFAVIILLHSLRWLHEAIAESTGITGSHIKIILILISPSLVYNDKPKNLLYVSSVTI